MSTPVVFLAAPGPVTHSVKDVLRDWVVLGLVQPFLWIDAAEVRGGSALSEVVATDVRGALAPRVRLQDYLADQQDIPNLRLVCVGAVGDRTSLVDEAVARTVLTPLQAILPVVAMQCLLTVQGAGGWDDSVAMPGWQTLVIAPEDRWNPNPRQPPTEFVAGGDPSERTAHGAATLAAVSGLWTGIDAGPFDTSTNHDLVAVRSYLRKLDASLVTAAVRESLMDVSDGLPRPATGTGRAEVVTDPANTSRSMLEDLTLRFPRLFALDLNQVPPKSTIKIGAWESILLFLKFLGDVIRSAPAAFVNRVVARGAAAVARVVQQTVFGNESEYEVLVLGVNAKGMPAGTEELGRMSDELARSLHRQTGGAEPALPDVSQFWNAVVGLSMTLADGGERISGLGPARVGLNPGVIADPRMIAPPPSAAVALPSSVSNRVGTDSVSPYDVRQQEAIARTMAAAAVDDVEATRAGERFAQMRAWTASTFTGQLGARISADIDRRHADLAALIQQLRSADTGADDVADPMRKTRSILLRLLLGILVIIGVVWVLKHYKVVGGLVLVAISAALLLAWIGSQLMAAFRHYSRVHALLRQRSAAQSALEVAASNVPKLAEGLTVSTALYGQYLLWAPILGRFLSEPFGPPVSTPEPVRLQGSLPRSVGFGFVRPVRAQVDDVAHQIGSQVFQPGWLTPLWESLLADAPRRIGPAAVTLRGAAQTLYGESARTRGTLLSQWSAILAAEGIEAETGLPLWERARDLLYSRGTAELMQSLMTEVEVQAQERIKGTLSGAEFFTALTDSLDDVGRHAFSTELFTQGAQMQDLHVVARTVAIGRPDVGSLGAATSTAVTWLPPTTQDRGLDQFLVVVQATNPAPASSFTLRGESRQVDPEPPQPPREDDDTALGG